VPLYDAVAAGGAVDAGDDVQEGGFAGAGRAHEREELALVDAQVDAVQCGDVELTLLEYLGEVADLDDRGFGRHGEK